jgi:uncharacterized protein (DUF1778 family)
MGKSRENKEEWERRMTSQKPPRVADQPRDARMALRLTAEEKSLVENAAAIGGEDASSFVRRAAIVEARRVMEHVKTRP